MQWQMGANGNMSKCECKSGLSGVDIHNTNTYTQVTEIPEQALKDWAP